MSGGPFVHDGCGACGEGSIHHIGVACNPVDSGRAPVDIRVLDVENGFRGGGYVGQVATGCVKGALGWAGGTAGVENEQRIFGVHRLGRAGIGLAGDQRGVPGVARVPVHPPAGAPRGGARGRLHRADPLESCSNPSSSVVEHHSSPLPQRLASGSSSRGLPRLRLRNRIGIRLWQKAL